MKRDSVGGGALDTAFESAQTAAVEPTVSLLERMMHPKRGPGRLFDTLFDYDDGRRQRCLCALPLLVLLLLIMPLAYARACDSTSNPGLYDAADYDDDVLFLIERAALAVSALAMRGVVFPAVHAQSQRRRAEVSRAPPRLSFAPYASAPHHAFATKLVSIAFS